MYRAGANLNFMLQLAGYCKVEKILKGSQNLIPSCSRSNENLSFLFYFLQQNIAGHCQQTFCQCFAFTPQATFPPIIEIFTEGEGIEIKSRLSS